MTDNGRSDEGAGQPSLYDAERPPFAGLPEPVSSRSERPPDPPPDQPVAPSRSGVALAAGAALLALPCVALLLRRRRRRRGRAG